MGQAAPFFLAALGDDGADARIEKVPFVGVRRMEIAGVQVLDRAAVAALAMGERADDGKLVGDAARAAAATRRG